MRFARYLAPGKWKSVGLEIPLADLNMQLVGSGAATGTLRMDRLSDDAADLSVAIHTCDVADTTAYIALPSGQVLANHPVADIEDFVINPCTGLVEAVLVVVDHTELIPISDSGKRYEQALSRLAVRLGREGAGDTILACSRSALDDVWVLCVTSDARPAEYYVIHFPYDISATVNPFVVSRPDLALYTLGEAEAVKIPSRTGELLSGYLTRPPTSPPKEPQPLALLLHGGPSARDCPGYNPIVQLLASRGISVLSVNYRGSTGYGMKFLKKGNGDVKGMHDDVEDARRWAVDNGIAHSNQIAILGGSWGGYLALGGAAYLSPASSLHGVETPTSCISNHRYAAVVAIVPPVTVGKANTSTAFRGDPLVARYWRQIYGDDVSDNLVAAELLSPLFHLQQLRGTKLLLIHGEDDPRVPREHGDIVAAAALELHVPGAYVTYAMEGHSIRREPNVLHMWHMTEKFLCQSLGLPSPPEVVADAVQNHTATVHWNSSQEIH
jgi:dipeptidyl aminopeptidase/acylaminoacyl peptidase